MLIRLLLLLTDAAVRERVQPSSPLATDLLILFSSLIDNFFKTTVSPP